MTHICVVKLTIIGSDNGLLPGLHQAIIWTNAGIFLIGAIGTNFSGILSEIHKFSLEKMRLKMLSGKWRPFCLGFNVLNHPLAVCKQHDMDPSQMFHYTWRGLQWVFMRLQAQERCAYDDESPVSFVLELTNCLLSLMLSRPLIINANY